MKISSIFAAIALSIALPAAAQNATQFQQENARLRAELQALQSRCETPAAANASWRNQSLEARIDSIRVGFQRTNVLVTVTMTLRNAGSDPMILNYETSSLSVTDDNGYPYTMYAERTDAEKTIKGIPATRFSKVDTSAVIMPGAARTVTFITNRYMRNGQTPGSRFDINATFGQYQDLGQGRVRKVRDFPVAFTNVAASGRGSASTATGNAASGLVDQAADHLLKRLIK